MNEEIDDNALIAEAELGERAREFLASELGRLMVGYADQDATDALTELVKISPTDTDGIRSLQTKAQMGQQFKMWLADTVTRGDNAIALFRAKRQEQ